MSYVLQSPKEGEHLVLEMEWDGRYSISKEDGELICQFGIYKDNIIYSFHKVDKEYKEFILEYSEKLAKGLIIL